MELVAVYDAFTREPVKGNPRPGLFYCAGVRQVKQKGGTTVCQNYIIRATVAEGQIRAFAATTRELTEFARQAHKHQSGGNGSPGTSSDGRHYDERS